MLKMIPWEPRKEIFYVVRTGLIVLSVALLFNVGHQCSVYRSRLAARANIAVFVSHEASARAEEIRQQLQAVPGIDHLFLVTPEEALAAALKDSPALSDVMVSGTNPFTAYFIVYPRPALPVQAVRLKEALKKVQDIEDVRSDDRLFTMIETLDSVGTLYRTGLMVIAAGFVLLVCMRCVDRWLYAPVSFQRVIVLLTGGLAGGALGMGLTALLMRAAPAGLAPLPAAALWLCLPAGMLLALHED